MSAGDELLAAIHIVRRPSECRVGHDVDGERGNVGWLHDAPDGKRRAELIAPSIEFSAEEFALKAACRRIRRQSG